jgi:beta-galactosidase
MRFLSPSARMKFNLSNRWASFLLAAQTVTVLALPVAAQTYSPPLNPRADINLDPGWRFIRQDVSGAQTNGFDDSTWTPLDLPHTWNNLDGQDGGNNYYRGIGWYRQHYVVDPSYTNRQFFLKFDGANIVSDVYVNGTLVGEHQGGFAAFVYDVTPYLIIGGDNVIAVKVNNASNTNVPPLSADFTFFGGVYRDVHLLVTDPVQISPLDYGSPGVYLRPTSVSSNSANLQVTTVLSNATAAAANVTVRAVVTDAATNIVVALTNVVTLPPASWSNVVASTTVTSPHLWNGLTDPYLYQAFVEIYRGSNVADLVSQPLGFRSTRVDPNNGFFLNGAYYDLHGVCMHQDWLNCGWALSNAQRETNFMFLKELGVTGVRLAHYQHNEYTYQLADRTGIILWSEVPLVNSTTETAAFYNNAKQQLRELIRQNYNHPSVVCWGMYNELSLNVNNGPTNLVNQLVQLEAQEDPTRPSTGATLASNGDANSWYPQVIAFNEYYGWYSSPLNGLAAWADNLHAAHPTNCIGISENGAGASIYQHSEDPVAWPTASGGAFHPEEWQNLVHETNWATLKARPFIWCKFLWNMFNFAVDSRNEGDTPGRNDKGLVTYDRLARKDAFYFYKANWTTNPMVYITGHTFTNRTSSITAKVYANCDSVELFVNGVSQGGQTSTNCVFTWPVTLRGGANSVSAVGSKRGAQVTDSLVWTTVTPPLSQGKPVTASSFQAGNDPSHGNDGNSSTRWAASDATYPQWWRVDLGGVQPIVAAVISWYNSSSRAYKYRIEISNDDATYTTLVDNTGNSTFGDTTDSFLAAARYVRVTVTGVSPTGGWAGFYECQILGAPTLTYPQSPGVLHLSWPNGGNWRLQAQTNASGQGLGTNWVTTPGTLTTNQLDLPIDAANPAVFYRLVSP